MYSSFSAGQFFINFMHHLHRHKRIAGPMNEGSYRHWQKIEAKGEQIMEAGKTAAGKAGEQW
ncbi:hypothetical protein DOE73_26130 [Paenibacillus dendritiformis]|nr:hypothetical protein DOE73_26130 [Paenibacillus dendritiformis]